MKHVAVFSDEVIKLIFEGKKTIDSRFSLKKIPPFGKIQANDLVYIKKSGGKIVGQFIAKRVIFFDNLSSEMMEKIKKDYNAKIRGDRYYWNAKNESLYGTLIFMDEVQPCLFPFHIIKNDRRPWVILDEGMISQNL